MNPYSFHPTFISRLHDHIRSARTTRHGALVHPDQAPTGQHKEYIRMPRIPLPASAPLLMSLQEAIKNRSSCKEYYSERLLSLQDLGTLLGTSIGMRSDSLRNYPSGGALYPIETYLIGKVLEDYPSGVFHYHPKSNALEFLWEIPTQFKMIDILRAPYLPIPPFVIIFTGVWDRTSIKYGDFGYLLSLIESGHMAQNILLTATALEIQSRPISGCDDATVLKLLDLDERFEQPIYSIAICP